MPSTPQISLVVPTFNEEANIQEVLHRAHRAISELTDQFEIVVVDDTSTDSTVALAKAVARDLPNVQVVERQGRRDLALSVIDGWNASQGEVLAVMDADLQHPPETLPSLLNLMAATGVDVGVASRNVEGGGSRNWSLRRRFVSWFATMLAGLLIPGVLRMVHDPMSGFFAVRRRVLKQAGLSPTGYKILLEILARASYQSVVEVPYTFEERKYGESKLGARQVGQYLRHLARLSVETGEVQLVLRYAAVGLSGILINFGVSALGGSWAQALGFEISVLTNFTLNELWTFRGKSRHTAMTQPVMRRLVSFQLISLFSLALNLGLSLALMRWFGVPQMTASVLGIGVAGVTNFVANVHLTWSFWQEDGILRPGGAIERRKASAVV